MALRNKIPAPVKPGTEKTALLQALHQAGLPTVAACGTCGASVSSEDDNAVQTWTVGRFSYDGFSAQHTPSWRYHGGVCDRIRRTISPDRDRVALAHMLDPDARPVLIDQAVVDVAATLGSPTLYKDVQTHQIGDKGTREPWGHIPTAERREMIKAVQERRAELKAEADRIPCALCGVWPVLERSPEVFQGGRTCASCGEAIQRARGKVGGLNSNLDLDAMAQRHLPENRVFNEEVIPAIRHTPTWKLAEGRERKPWGHLSTGLAYRSLEERLAELEARTGGPEVGDRLVGADAT